MNDITMRQVPQCMKQQQAAGGISPRTCERCGLGPCQMYQPKECPVTEINPCPYNCAPGECQEREQNTRCPDGSHCRQACTHDETCKRVASGKQRNFRNCITSDHINEYCNATIELLAITLYKDRYTTGGPAWYTLTHELRQHWRKIASGVLPLS